MGVIFTSAIWISSLTVASVSGVVLPGTPLNWFFCRCSAGSALSSLLVFLLWFIVHIQHCDGAEFRWFLSCISFREAYYYPVLFCAVTVFIMHISFRRPCKVAFNCWPIGFIEFPPNAVTSRGFILLILFRTCFVSFIYVYRTIRCVCIYLSCGLRSSSYQVGDRFFIHCNCVVFPS